MNIRTIPPLLIVFIVILAAIFSPRLMTINEQVDGDRDIVRANNAVLDAEHFQRTSLRRERSTELEKERKAARVLAASFIQRAGEDFVPKELLAQAADMKISQIRTMVMEIGKNRELHGGIRTVLVGEMTAAWLRKNENEPRRAESLKQMLDIFDEVMPALPPGDRFSHVRYTIMITHEWDAMLWTDFIENHWGNWINTTDIKDAETIRRFHLKMSVDPGQIRRLENLKYAGTQSK